MNDLVVNVAEYVILGHTIEETARYFNKSESSIKKYLAKVRDESDPLHDKILAKRLALAQRRLYLMGIKKGGQIGKRGSTITEEDARRFASLLIKGYSFRELERITGIPKSTIFDAIKRIDDPELHRQIEASYKEEDKGVGR